MSAKSPCSDEGAGTPDRYSDHFESDDEKKTSEQKSTPASKKIAGHQDKCELNGCCIVHVTDICFLYIFVHFSF